MDKAKWIRKYGTRDGKITLESDVQVAEAEPVDSPDPEDNPPSLDATFVIDCKFPGDQFQIEFTVKNVGGTLSVTRQTPEYIKEMFLQSLRDVFGGSVS